MVVLGGLTALLGSDDEAECDDSEKNNNNPTLPPTESFLTPRPWAVLYNNRVRAPVDGTQSKLSAIQKMIPNELLVEIFKRCAPADVSRCACACRLWRLLANDESIWEAACLRAFEFRETPAGTKKIAREKFRGSFRQMFWNRPRLRTEGLYVSRNTYVKAGITDWDNVKPVHLVVYYRYFRFFNNGEFVSKTSPERLEKVCKLFRSNFLLAKDEGVRHGSYGDAFPDDDARLHLECVPTHRLDNTHTTLHMWLRLRGTIPGSSNRLDFVKLAGVDGFGGIDESDAPHPSLGQWQEVDDPELAYRRSCGIGVKQYNGTAPVRDFARGLNTAVFVPWEQSGTHVLNNGTDEMDFFVAG